MRQTLIIRNVNFKILVSVFFELDKATGSVKCRSDATNKPDRYLFFDPRLFIFIDFDGTYNRLTLTICLERLQSGEPNAMSCLFNTLSKNNERQVQFGKNTWLG